MLESPRMTVSKLQTSALTAALVLGALGLLFAVHLQYPLSDWLFWRYVGYWSLSAFWLTSCFGLGLRLFDLFGLRDLPGDQRWLFGLALGVLAFGMVMFALGFLGLWSGWLFALLPLAFLAIGRLEIAAAWRALRSRSKRGGFPNRLSAAAVVGLGTVGFILIYLPIVNPNNLGYDPRWYHLVFAEQYAVRGGIEAFSEGWLLGAYPQLASTVYGWAFLLPASTLFDRIELCMHLELTVFLATLASVPVLARALIDEPQPYAWVYMLLFPGLYLYDSNLIGGADHFAAFWAVPILLAAWRAWNEFTVRPVILVTVLASAALLTKYTAAGLALGPGLFLLGRAAYLCVRSGAARKRTLIALGAGAVTGLVVTSPHWLKNLVFYGDPLFPFLRSVFTPRPWVANAADRLAVFTPTHWQAEHSLRGVLNTLGSPFSFAFWPHDWREFHGSVPIFGFLYTLTMPAIFLVPKWRRIVLVYAVISVGVMFWYWTFHQDRYLQVYLPWMAACVAAVVTQAWRLGAGVRAGLVILFAAQLIAGAGVPFLPAHALVKRSPYVTSIELIGGWFSKKRPDLEAPLGAYSELESVLPPDARVLVHDEHVVLGIRRPVVSDAIAWQTGIDYSAQLRPSEIWTLLRSFEITHVVWKRDAGFALSSIGGEVAFRYFATNYLEDLKLRRGLRIGAVPPEPPSDDQFFGRVAVLGCEESYRNGVYPIGALTQTWLRGPPDKSSTPVPEQTIEPTLRPKRLEELFASVDAVRVETKCVPKKRLPRSGFMKALQRAGVALYVRKLPRPESSP